MLNFYSKYSIIPKDAIILDVEVEYNFIFFKLRKILISKIDYELKEGYLHINPKYKDKKINVYFEKLPVRVM